MSLVENEKISADWELQPLECVANIIRGISFPKDAKQTSHFEGAVACLRTANVQKEVDWEDLWYVSQTFVKKQEQFIKSDDILMSTANSLELLGKCSLVRKVPIKSTLGTFIINIRPKENTAAKYLYYYFCCRDFLEMVRKNGSTTTNISNISVGKLEKIPVKITSPENQHRIVSKIEELFSELDAGIASLKTAQQQLQTYRQSVLKHAFENVGSDSFKTVEECCTHVVDCLHSTAKFVDEGYYCIDTTCIENGKILFEKARFVDAPTFEDRIRRLKPESGDILFAREGTVGTTVIVPQNIELCLGQRMMMFRLKTNILSKYFMYFLQSPCFKSQYQPLIGGTTAPHLNIRDIKKFAVYYCSPREQQSTIDRIESTLSESDLLLQTINHQLTTAESLRQSILQRAFSGEL